ncbi:MAG: hypothetical protein GY755_13035 [Chloroflexi bacterium]|nr:hypothetical protein [Chloroflexota bacterium]
MEQLIEAGLDNIRFSLDGATKETYESIRKGSNFEKVIANIEKLLALKQKLGKDNPNIAIVFVAMKRNIQELPLLEEIANKYNIKDMTVHGFECYSKELEQEILYYEYSEETEQYFQEAKTKAEEYGIRIQLPKTEITQQLPCDRKKFCIITWNGEVCPCTPLSYSREVYQKEKVANLKKLSFGNLRDTTFEQIWNSKPYRKKYEHCKDCLMQTDVIVPQPD